MPAKVTALAGRLSSRNRDLLTQFNNGESVVNNKVSSPKNGSNQIDIAAVLKPPMQMLGHSLSMASIPIKSRHRIMKTKRISEHKPNVSPETIQLNKANKHAKYQKHLNEHRRSLHGDNFKVGTSPRGILNSSISMIQK